MRDLAEMTLDELREVYDVAVPTGPARAAWAERQRRPGPPGTPPRWSRRRSGRPRLAMPEGSTLYPSEREKERARLNAAARAYYGSKQ